MRNLFIVLFILFGLKSYCQSEIDLLNSGNAKSNLKDYQGAILDYSNAIEINSNYSKAYFARGIVKLLLDDYQGAINDYTKVIKIDPNYSRAYFNRG